MLETILLGSFFFGSEPEQFLFLLYTIMFIWSSTMRSVSYPPVFAPHVLDVVAASSEACEGCSSEQLVSKKYCGRSIGEVAATCGISLAASVYFDPQRLRLSREFIDGMIDEETKRKIRKKVRHVMSYVLGVTVNFIGDVESWWADQNFLQKDSTETEL
mmetsp:Transcript_13463/g.33874  ORF Transcript_13463/g.33874 Transcript_13463/m.33874 type:complete len:159 (+) Transcript_13463:247-723(+)